jgi:hypothetical protein
MLHFKLAPTQSIYQFILSSLPECDYMAFKNI